MAIFQTDERTELTPYTCIYRLEDGCIAEAWAEWDNLSGLRQLGHLKD